MVPEANRSDPRCNDGKPQPHADDDEFHQHDWILVAKMFPVEADHALVFVPFHEQGPILAAATLVMDDRRIGHEEDLPAAFACPHAEVEILAVEEVAFVHQTEIVDGFPRDEGAGSRNGLDLDRRLRERLTVKMKIIE
jgi:hypothetical protein